MNYKEFTTKTFWGRFVDNMIFFIIVNIFESIFYLFIKQSDWVELSLVLGADIVLSLIFAALGFGWTKFYHKGIKKKKKE